MSPETKLYKSDYRIHKELLGKMEVVEENIKERIIRDLANRILQDMPIEKVKSMFNFVEKEDQNSLLQENATFVKFTMSVEL